MSNLPNYGIMHEEDQIASFCNVRDDLKHLTIPEIRQIAQEDRLPYAVATLSVTGDLNVGAMLRTAHLMGAREAFVIGRRKLDRRSLVGIQNYFTIHRLEGRNEDMMTINAERVVEIFNEYNMFPIVMEQGGTPLPAVSWPAVFENTVRTPCVCVGNEGRGIEPDVLEAMATIPGFCQISIPQRGVSRSFNVGHCLSIVLWDLTSKMGWM
jgi:tRNA G18 (ribose-2'-O)-methylase SpoU